MSAAAGDDDAPPPPAPASSIPPRLALHTTASPLPSTLPQYPDRTRPSTPLLASTCPTCSHYLQPPHGAVSTLGRQRSGTTAAAPSEFLRTAAASALSPRLAYRASRGKYPSENGAAFGGASPPTITSRLSLDDPASSSARNSATVIDGLGISKIAIGSGQPPSVYGTMLSTSIDIDYLEQVLRSPDPMLLNPTAGSPVAHTSDAYEENVRRLSTSSGMYRANSVSQQQRYLSRRHAQDMSPSPRSSFRQQPYTVADEEDLVAGVDLGYSDWADMAGLRVMYYSSNTGPLHAKTLPDIRCRTDASDTDDLRLADLLRDAAATTWINICRPTTAELHLLARTYRIHPLTVEDIITEDTREKCESFRGYYFVCYRTWEMHAATDMVDDSVASEGFLEAVGVYMIVIPRCATILTFHHRPVPHIRSVLRRIATLKPSAATGGPSHTIVTPDWICYGLVDSITDIFFPLIADIQIDVDAIDELVLIIRASEQQDMLRRIGRVRRRVMAAVRLIVGKADVVRAVIKRTEDANGSLNTTTADLVLLYQDVQDHCLTMLSSITHYEKIVARAHSNYLAQISIELTESSNRTNDVVARLTVLASILVPMNVVTGLWGMNVKVPGQDEEGLAWFIGICAGLVVIGVVLFVIMRRVQVV